MIMYCNMFLKIPSTPCSCTRSTVLESYILFKYKVIKTWEKEMSEETQDNSSDIFRITVIGKTPTEFCRPCSYIVQVRLQEQQRIFE